MNAIARLNVKVVPKSSTSAVVGWLGDALKIRVTAPPEKGKANQAVVVLLSQTLRVSRDRVAVVAGLSSARKQVEILGLSQQDVVSLLSSACPPSGDAQGVVSPPSS